MKSMARLVLRTSLILLTFYIGKGFTFFQARDTELTFILPAGQKECFFQTVARNTSMEVEYQVIGGAGLDVDFFVSDPFETMVVMDYRRSDGLHTIEPTEEGDYKICFDNSFSTISEKLVFFEVIFDSVQDDGDTDEWSESVEPEELLDIKIDYIKDSIEAMRNRFEKSIQMQTLLRAFEARDRNLQDNNLERVNFWSAVNLGVMVVVAVLQVYTLKSLFNDRRRVRT